MPIPEIIIFIITHIRFTCHQLQKKYSVLWIKIYVFHYVIVGNGIQAYRRKLPLLSNGFDA